MVGRVHINTLHLLTYHHHDLCIQDTEQLRQYVYSYGDHVDDSTATINVLLHTVMRRGGGGDGGCGSGGGRGGRMLLSKDP